MRHHRVSRLLTEAHDRRANGRVWDGKLLFRLSGGIRIWNGGLLTNEQNHTGRQRDCNQNQNILYCLLYYFLRLHHPEWLPAFVLSFVRSITGLFVVCCWESGCCCCPVKNTTVRSDLRALADHADSSDSPNHRWGFPPCLLPPTAIKPGFGNHWTYIPACCIS